MSESELQQLAEEMEKVAELEAAMCSVMEILGDICSSGMFE